MGGEIIRVAPLTAYRPLDAHPAAVYLARLAPRSRPVQRGALDIVAGILTDGRCDALTLEWERIRYQHTAAVRAILSDGRYAPATANRMLSALRGVLREAWRLGLMDIESCERACDLQPIRGHRERAGRALDGRELATLLVTCEGDAPVDRRDAGLLCTLYSGGLRRAEAASLDRGDYDRAGMALRVRGKGNKERTCYLADFAADRLNAYLDGCAITDGPIFRRAVRGGRLTDHRLTDAAVRDIIRRRCEQAGIAAANPHDFRRTMVSDLLDAGVDLATVQSIAGHSNPATTARYDRRGDDAKRRAVQRLRIEG